MQAGLAGVHFGPDGRLGGKGRSATLRTVIGETAIKTDPVCIPAIILIGAVFMTDQLKVPWNEYL